MVKLYILGNREFGLQMSPYAWRIVLALKHKRIDHECQTLSREEVGPIISQITEGKWKKVPLIQFDDATCFYDSFDIAIELERRYPDNTKLFPNGPSNAKFYGEYYNIYRTPIFKRLIFKMPKCYSGEGFAHFRRTREAGFGCTLEEYVGDVDSHLESADEVFNPLRAALKHSSFLEGDQPTYSDYIFCASLQRVKTIAPDDFDIYVTNHKDNALSIWYNGLDQNLSGYLKSAKTIRDIV